MENEDLGRPLGKTVCFGKTTQRDHLVCKCNCSITIGRRNMQGRGLKAPFSSVSSNDTMEDSLHLSNFGSLKENKFLQNAFRDCFDSKALLIIWKKKLLQN